MKRTAKKTVAKHDWSRLDAMTAAEKHAAAMSDPDARPLTEEDMRRMKRTPRAKIIRRALGLSQEDFAARYTYRSGRYAIGSRGASSQIKPHAPISPSLPATRKPCAKRSISHTDRAPDNGAMRGVCARRTVSSWDYCVTPQDDGRTGSDKSRAPGGHVQQRQAW